MAEISKKDTVNHLHTGGSDIGLAVKLSEAEAQQIYGATAVAGWYVPFTFEGGSVAFEVESEEDKDEAGQLTGKTIETSAEFVLTNTFKETSDQAEDLVDDILSQGFHDYRYALPVGVQPVDDGAGGTVDKEAHKLYGIHNGKIEPGWSIEVADGTKRTRQMTLRSTKQGTTPAFVRGIVDMADQTNWAAKFNDFKDLP
ncbi:MAG: hypothetical protein AAGK22_30685 [Acidobacteriota bacterium]